MTRFTKPALPLADQIAHLRGGEVREIAEQLFTWGGEVSFEKPDALRERLARSATSICVSEETG